MTSARVEEEGKNLKIHENGELESVFTYIQLRQFTSDAKNVWDSVQNLEVRGKPDEISCICVAA